MSTLLDRLRAIVARFWPFAAPPQPVLPEPPAAPHKPESDESFGRHFTLDGLLDRLDNYHDALSQLRTRDPEGFRFYRHIGGQVLPRSMLFEIAENPTANVFRPAFGMIHFLDDEDDKDTIAPSLLYYRKYAARPYVEPTNDELYEITMYYRDTKRRNFSAFVIFHVSFGNGQARLLRERHVVPQRLPRGGTIHHHNWQHPPVFKDMVEDRRRRYPHLRETPESLALGLFRLIINATINASDGLLVIAAKDGIMARFSVDMLRTPYFFRDREKTITESGKTRKIFHIARTHKRRLADGREIYVKSHFRGERKFTWKGYQITITMPGLHHAPIEAFDAPAHEFENDEPPPGFVDSTVAAKKIGVALRH